MIIINKAKLINLFIRMKIHLFILVYLLIPNTFINRQIILLTYAFTNQSLHFPNEHLVQHLIAPKQVIIYGFSSSANSSQQQPQQSSSNLIKSFTPHHMIEVKQGERVTLLCSASPSEPPPRVKWFRKNTELLPGMYLAYFSLLHLHLIFHHIITQFAYDTCFCCR